MGKAKRNRNRGPRHNPLGLNGNGVKEEAELNGAGLTTKNESLVDNVTEQLQSHDESSKLCGLHMLADVFDGRTLEEVVQHRMVRIAGPLLVDPSPAVRNAASGALRNLTAAGGPEFCDVLVEQDVMTSLCALLQKFGNTWVPKTVGTSESDEDADTFINAVNMLWNLCESNSRALKYFNEAHLLPLLVRCLDVNIFGIDVAVSVAECLHSVTEDNQDAITEMQGVSAELQQLLVSPSDDVNIMLLTVLISGVLLNISVGGVTAIDPNRLTLIMATISSSLGFDQRQMLNKLTSELELNIQKLNPRLKKKREIVDEEMDEEEMQEDEVSKAHENAKKGEPDEEMEGSSSKPPSNKTRGKSTFVSERTVDVLKQESKSISNVARLLQAQQVALEILANLCAGDDDERPHDNDDSESDEMSEASFGDDPESQESIPISVSKDVLEAIVSQRLITKVWDKTILPAENVYELITEHQECQTISNRISLLRSRAFLCLQNMLGVMDLEELGGCNDLYNMWLETTKLVFQKTKAEDLPLLEAATSVMRAAVLRLAQAKATQFTSLSADDLQILLNGQSQCKDPNVRANLIRIVGCIGQMLATVDSAHIPTIGKFLLEVASHDAELWIAAEALDCIYDVFGEDETDKAAFDIGLVNKLNALAPSLKNKVRRQKKTLGDHYSVVMTASSNLNRFIKYKSIRVAKFSSNGHS